MTLFVINWGGKDAKIAPKFLSIRELLQIAIFGTPFATHRAGVAGRG
jgi:hypothetical protein